MIRTLALICFIAAPSIGTTSVGFKRTFGLWGWGSSAFVSMPQTIVLATEAGWVETTRPSGPSGYENLTMYCPQDDFTVCVLFDPLTDYVAGLQISLDKAHFTPTFDMDTLGFSNWNTTVNGTSTQFYSINQFFMSTEMLATDPASRTNCDNSSVLQENVYLTGFNGEVYKVSTNTSELTDSSTSPFTEQACIIFMGHHYYYKMTNTTECTANTMFPWFPITYAEELVATGLMVFGIYDISTNIPSQFEQPTRAAVETIVPNGPECFYECAGEGVVTMHTYYIDNIAPVLCLFESFL